MSSIKIEIVKFPEKESRAFTGEKHGCALLLSCGLGDKESRDFLGYLYKICPDFLLRDKGEIQKLFNISVAKGLSMSKYLNDKPYEISILIGFKEKPKE